MISVEVANDQQIIDIHVHHWGQQEVDDEFLEFAKAWKMPFGVSCLGPYGGFIMNPSSTECVKANDLVIKQMERHPELVHGFCYINPLHGGSAIAEIRRCVSQHGMIGIKLWVACRCNDVTVRPVVEEAVSLGVPILQHAFMRLGENLPGESYPADVAELAATYPDAQIIMAHMGYHWWKGVGAVKDYANVLVDTSGGDAEAGSVEHAVSLLGVDRVLYGSDAPGRDVLCQIGRVVAADISDSDRQMILFSNAARLLNITARNRSVG